VALSDALNRTATIKTVIFDDDGQETYTPLLTNVPTRKEETQRLVRDERLHEIRTNYLFFFDIADVPEGSLKADYVIELGGIDYKVIEAQLLDDRTGPHHWEVKTL